MLDTVKNAPVNGLDLVTLGEVVVTREPRETCLVTVEIAEGEVVDDTHEPVELQQRGVEAAVPLAGARLRRLAALLQEFQVVLGEHGKTRQIGNASDRFGP